MKKKAEQVLEPLHPDFQKILRMFQQRYGEDEGEQIFWAWVRKRGLDPDKPYTWPQESFSWAEPLIRLYREEEDAKLYKVEALFPVSSMNRNVYLEDELLLAARSLVGKPVNINHESAPLEGVEIVGAEYEDGAVECLIRVRKDATFEGGKIVDMIDSGEISHVSIEAVCQAGLEPADEGAVCRGLVFTGLALLTRDALPGVPLTRIMPVEKIVESFQPSDEQFTRRLCSLCGRPVSDYVLLANHVVHPGCARKFWRIAMDVFHFQEGIKMECEEKLKQEEEKENVEREWDTAFINKLPDAAFAVIEPAYQRGETDDKRCRHLPHHGPNVKNPNEHSSVDLPHLRNALARMNQIKPVTDSISTEELRRRAKQHLIRHAKELLPGSQWADQEKLLLAEKLLELFEAENRLLTEQVEQVQSKLREVLEEKKTLEERLRKAKRYSRIIVRI